MKREVQTNIVEWFYKEYRRDEEDQKRKRVSSSFREELNKYFEKCAQDC
jgi:hypothetical protein